MLYQALTLSNIKGKELLNIYQKQKAETPQTTNNNSFYQIMETLRRKLLDRNEVQMYAEKIGFVLRELELIVLEGNDKSSAERYKRMKETLKSFTKRNNQSARHIRIRTHSGGFSPNKMQSFEKPHSNICFIESSVNIQSTNNLL